MRISLLTLAVVFGLFGSIAAPIRAHHSVRGSHDVTKVVALTGTIAKVDWMNPHVWITLTVTKPNGGIAPERVEIAAPGRLTKIGFNAIFLKFGEPVTIEVWMPKNDPRFAASAPSGRLLILPDGRRFDVGDSWADR